jgi:hypothetical protein
VYENLRLNGLYDGNPPRAREQIETGAGLFGAQQSAASPCLLSLRSSLNRRCGSDWTPLHGGFQVLDQGPYLERLGEDADSPGIQSLRAYALVLDRRDENDRNLAPLNLELSLELKPAHSWHSDVQDQAGIVGHLGRSQEVLGRREGEGKVSQRAQESLQRLSDRRIIIDD